MTVVDSQPAARRLATLASQTGDSASRGRTEPDRWWQRAACAGRDPAWWSSEDRPMWPAAVRLCLACPVRDSCLQDAVQQRDNGVIRAGMLLADTSRGYAVVSLICANCGLRPVRLTESGGIPHYCGRTCQVAAHTQRRAAGPRAPALRG